MDIVSSWGPYIATKGAAKLAFLTKLSARKGRSSLARLLLHAKLDGTRTFNLVAYIL
jgi:hypothetical protein